MRDNRETNWFWSDNAIFDREDIDTFEKIVYLALARFAGSKDSCFPSLEKLMKATGIKAEKTIKKYIKSLLDKGLIQVEYRTGKSNIYYLETVKPPVRNTGGNECTPGNSYPHTPGNSYPPKKNKEEKQKEKINKKEILIEHIQELDMEQERKEVFIEWIEYKQEIKNQYSSRKSIDILIKQWKNYDISTLKAALEKSIANGYKGLFVPKEPIKPKSYNPDSIDNMEVFR